MNEEIKVVLTEAANMLAGAENQGDPRVQELNTSFRWLMEAANKGLGQAVSEFNKEVLEVTR